MGFTTWNDHYSVNVPEIDEQHKKLIALANQLYDAMRAGKTLETARAKTRHSPITSSRPMTVPPSYCFLSLHISSFSQARGLPEPLGHRLSVGNPQLSGP
jgi:hypothetical protein